MITKLFRFVSCTSNDIIVEERLFESTEKAILIAKRYIEDGLAESVSLFEHEDLNSCGIIRFVHTYVKEV